MISLHYANVTIGTPAQWFLVALDTGSDLFWLPCNCNSTCVRSMETDQGEVIKYYLGMLFIMTLKLDHLLRHTCMHRG